MELLSGFGIKNDYITINDDQIYLKTLQFPKDNYATTIIIKNGKLYYINVTEFHVTDLSSHPITVLISKFINSNSILNYYSTIIF